MRRPRKVKCSACRERIGTDEKYCGFCGAENAYYDPESWKDHGKAAVGDRRHFRTVMSLLIVVLAAAVYYTAAMLTLLPKFW